MNKKNQHLIWIDLEMTGLSPETECILELATIVTDSELTVLAEGPVFAIHQSDEILLRMDEWNTKQHHASGLVERVRNSDITEAHAEKETLKFLSQYLSPGESPMCGNSIGLDRQFLVRYMPTLAAFFHYRNVDVSTIKELAARWRPDLLAAFQKESKHLALEDIRESIEELRYYRSYFFNEIGAHPHG